MEFPKSRILTSSNLSNILRDNNTTERFCFVLGAGASVESGIPSSSILGMDWMNCLMGYASDRGTPPKNPENTRYYAERLFSEGRISHPFDEIVEAWEHARMYSNHISSTYYFDIFQLRFYPNLRSGYRYLHRIFEHYRPSIGYLPLALLLTESNSNNLVITSNIDNLIEESLYLYTNKRPWVVSLETLDNYLYPDILRPVIAKVSHIPLFDPFNTPNTTHHPQSQWNHALEHAFDTYTPIVIGYGNTNHGLMDTLLKTRFRNGIYWCYRKTNGLPGEHILDFLKKQDGFLVEIDGFDSLMVKIGCDLFPHRFSPSGTLEYFQTQADHRIAEYMELWNNLNNHAYNKVMEPIHITGKESRENRSSKDTLTYWDHYALANAASGMGNYEAALKEYTLAIEKDPTKALAYHNRGFSYSNLQKPKQAIQDYDKAIELDPYNATAYYNRGNSYGDINQYGQAILDYDKAIVLDPSGASAFYNRGKIYDILGQYKLAYYDYREALILDAELPKQRIQEFINKQYHYLVDIDGFNDFIEKFRYILQVDTNNQQEAQMNTTSANIKKTVFLSYSWDSDAHKAWVKSLYDRLVTEGFNMILDEVDIVPGDHIAKFMEQSVNKSDYVLIICTPTYKEKADARRGGVGYEGSVITNEVLQTENHRKFIPIIASGSRTTSTPIWAAGKYSIDLSNVSIFESEFNKLVKAMKR